MNSLQVCSCEIEMSALVNRAKTPITHRLTELLFRHWLKRNSDAVTQMNNDFPFIENCPKQINRRSLAQIKNGPYLRPKLSPPICFPAFPNKMIPFRESPLPLSIHEGKMLNHDPQ